MPFILVRWTGHLIVCCMISPDFLLCKFVFKNISIWCWTITIQLYLMTSLLRQYMANDVMRMICQERDLYLAFPVITLCNVNSSTKKKPQQGHMKVCYPAMPTGYAPTTYGRSTILFPTWVWLILEVWRYQFALLHFANAAIYLSSASSCQFLVTCQWNV